MLSLIVLSAASVNAQVRIGGTTDPQGAAVLDLNANNDATPANKGALALPRVNLSSATAQLNGTAPINGMMVYHTGTTLEGTGVYVWTGGKWTKVNAGSLTITNGMIAANAIDSTKIINGTVGLEDIRDEIISNTKLMNGTITGAKIASRTIEPDKMYSTSADSAKVLMSNGTSAFWGSPTTPRDTTDRVLGLLPTTPAVTWTKIVDSPVNVKFRAAHYQVVYVPNLVDTDFCRLTFQANKVLVEVINGAVYTYSVDRIAIDRNTRLLCYRPSL